MTELKRKCFNFEKDDLEWINPLLEEWREENEGKTQSDLVLQLLREYQGREPQLKETLDMATSSMKEKLSDFSVRSKDVLDDVVVKSKDGLLTMQSRVQSGGSKLMDQLRKVESDFRTRLEDMKAERKESDDDPEEE